jgi:hypothetical protein
MMHAAGLGRAVFRAPMAQPPAARRQQQQQQQQQQQRPLASTAAATPRSHRRCRRAIVVVAAGAAPNGDDPSGNSADIDALAAMLSARAAEMRASMDGPVVDDPAALDEAAPAAAAAATPPAADPAALAAAEARALGAVGEGGFQGADFALVQQLGRLSVGRSTSRGGAGDPPSASVAAVAYAARYEPGVPFQQPAPVLLKEYLQRALALNELLAVARLQEASRDPAADEAEEEARKSAPDNPDADEAAVLAAARRNRPVLPPAGGKWRAATAPPRPGEPPIVPLLGYFESPASAAARAALGLPPARAQEDEEEDDDGTAATTAAAATFWLVYRWEGMRPLSWFLDSAEPLPLPAMRVAEKRLRAARRKRRQLARGEAVAGGRGSDGSERADAAGNFFARALRALRRAGPSRAEAALARRAAFLRAASAGALAALAHCHGRGVAHGSLGAGCVMVSAEADDALSASGEPAASSSSSAAGPGGWRPQPPSVRVKLDNFGLATVGASRTGGGAAGSGEEEQAGGRGGDEARLADARAADLQALGATLAEAFVVGMSCHGGGGGDWEEDEDEDEDEEGDEGGSSSSGRSKQKRPRGPRPPPPPPVRGAALQRLLFQLYGPDDKIRASLSAGDDDRSTLRAYLLEEQSGAYAPLVAFLDEDGGGGWALLAALVAGRSPAALLLSAHAGWLSGGAAASGADS